MWPLTQSAEAMRQTQCMVRIPGTGSLPSGPEGRSSGNHSATLRDGSRVLIGRVTAHDAPTLADGFARLSEESRRLRFLTSKPNLTRAELRYLTEVDGHNHEALGAIDLETGRGVGIARYVRDVRNPTHAEAAVTVADEWQRRGLGKLLLERLTDRARAERITHFTALVASDNAGVKALVNRLGQPVQITHIRGGTFLYEVELGGRGLGGQLEQALRAAATGHFQLPPRLRQVLGSLVPTHLGHRDRGGPDRLH
jgi:GNAT superfamily N-acetyltransferase